MYEALDCLCKVVQSSFDKWFIAENISASSLAVCYLNSAHASEVYLVDFGCLDIIYKILQSGYHKSCL